MVPHSRRDLCDAERRVRRSNRPQRTLAYSLMQMKELPHRHAAPQRAESVVSHAL